MTDEENAEGIKQFQYEIFVHSDNERLIKRIEQLEKENAELKAENKKLKDCRNCDHSENNFCKQRKLFISNNIANGCKYWEMYK